MVETQFDRKIKCVRTDNAKEFDISEFYKSKGIIHQNSCVYTPQQNSIVERKHQHLLNVARTLRLQAHLPLCFWTDCVLHAAYLINITPTPLLLNKTPSEMLYGQPPNFDNLRVFGCLTYASVLPKPKTKLHARAIRCMFIGFPKIMKGYRLFNIETIEVFVSRDVVFSEYIFPFAKEKTGFNKIVYPANENNTVTETVIRKKKVSTENGLVPPSVCDLPVFNDSTLEVSSDFGQDNSVSVEHVDSDKHQPLVVSSSRPGRIRKLPHHLKDYEVSLPKTKTSPHTIAQVLSYQNVSPKHLSYVSNVEILKEPKTYNQAILHDSWKTAMKEEIIALENNHTWDLVSLPPGKQTIGCKWVFRTKLKSDGSLERYKARLVAKGYTQQLGIDYIDTFSPVAKLTTIRTILAVAASKNWCLQQLDINNAFLHGYLQEEVYMQPPPGYTDKNSGLVCKLKKSLYGLKQASRKWNERLTSALLDQGFKQASSDSSLFVKGKEEHFIALVVFVDDIVLVSPSVTAITAIKHFLHETFKIKDLGDLKYFLGFEVARSSKGINLCQRKYTLELLQEFGFLECLILFLLCKQLSQFLSAPTDLHMVAAHRILRYLKGSPGQGLFFPSSNELKISAFFDSDWASCPDSRKSTTGFCIFLGSALISRKSKKQSMVSRSSSEAEYMALAAVACEIQWIKYLLTDLHILLSSANLYCDNLSAIKIAENPVHHERTKHIEIDCHLIREKIRSGLITLLPVSSSNQLADCFTKALSVSIFSSSISKLGIQNLYAPT
ncbi:hypothetical protein GQ457_05G017780 [Hibiscus cannabinus]